MKRMLLVLVLAGGVVGCEVRSGVYRGPQVNPLTLLNLDVGMEEAICDYGLKTNKFRNKGDCNDFWKEKYSRLKREMEEMDFGSVSNLNEDNVRFGVRKSGIGLVMYIGESPDYTSSPKVSIMIGNEISWYRSWHKK